MAILFTEGFEHYSASGSPGYANIGCRWDYPNTVGYYSYPTGNNSLRCLKFSSSTSSYNTISQPVSLQSFAVGMDVKGEKSDYGYQSIFWFESPDGSIINLKTKGISNVAGYGTIELAVGGNTYLCDTSIPLNLNTWYYLEMKVEYISANKINVVIRQDGREIGSFSNITGWNSAPYQWSKFVLGKPAGSYDEEFFCDNLYITDGELLGPLEINTIVPNGDASTTWQRSYGSTNYFNVNNGGSHYLSYSITSTQPGADEYDMSNITIAADKVIVGVVPHMFVHGAPYGSPDIRWNLVSDGNVASSSNYKITNHHMQYVGGSVITTSPFTNKKWTVSELNNLRAGPEWPTN